MLRSVRIRFRPAESIGEFFWSHARREGRRVYDGIAVEKVIHDELKNGDQCDGDAGLSSPVQLVS
jgi:hypothetical protein